MLGKRKVFDLTNTVMNYLFLIFILLAGIYFASFWIELKDVFLSSLTQMINVIAWTITGLSVIMTVLALVIAVADHDFRWAALLWCILRMALCIALAVVIDVSMILVSEGIAVSL